MDFEADVAGVAAGFEEVVGGPAVGYEFGGVEFGDADVVDPSGDGGDVADGTHAECVPVVELPDFEESFGGGHEVWGDEVAGVVGL